MSLFIAFFCNANPLDEVNLLGIYVQADFWYDLRFLNLDRPTIVVLGYRIGRDERTTVFVRFLKNGI